jgi:50S ribosomal subunit-associated GTPase HflX
MPEPITTSAVAVDVSVKLLEMVAPKGLAKVYTWLKGVELLVLGQARAGKTTFIDYLRHGLLDNENAVEKTLRKEISPMFAIKMGKTSQLELTVRRVVDLPGQLGPVEHANLAFERNPQSITLFLDATRPLRDPPDRGSLDWLKTFVERAEYLWEFEGRRRRNRLRSLTIVLNKIDKVQKRVLRDHIADYEETAHRMKYLRGKYVARVRVMPCVAVRSKYDSTLIDAVIESIAKDIAR